MGEMCATTFFSLAIWVVKWRPVTKVQRQVLACCKTQSHHCQKHPARWRQAW